MLNIRQLGKTLGGRVLLRDVTFHVNRGDRIGLVGANGAGKSTLFRIIIGEQAQDCGTVTLAPGISLGYLPQETVVCDGRTVLETAVSVSPEIDGLYARLHAPGADRETIAAARARLDELRIYEVEPCAKKTLAGLGFRQTDFDRPLADMSGGWIMRAHLARLLTQAPDLLLLDELTNHLDLDALEWLRDYLGKYSGAVLMISHDRAFLNLVVNRIFEINQGAISRYRGNYDDYLREREARLARRQAAYASQQKQIASLRQFVDRFRYKATKAAQAQSKLKQMARLEIIPPPVEPVRTISFQWPQPPRSGRRVLTLQGVRHAYGDLTVYDDLNYELERGRRTVLVGPNGAGKSTLLKLMAGVLPLQSGGREPGLNVKIGYYAQHRLDMLTPERTVFEEALSVGSPEQTVRNMLGAFMFSGDDVFKRVAVLSGGEKSRLALVKLLLDPPNLLLMDEPTTHLDIPGMDALINALRQYNGTLVFISHDVYFIRAIADTVLHIQSGRLTPYAGNYDYYLDRMHNTAAQTAGTPPAVASTVPAAAVNRRKPPGRQRQNRVRLKQLALLENRIAGLEDRRTLLTGRLELPATHAAPGAVQAVGRELSELTDTLNGLYVEWERMIEDTD